MKLSFSVLIILGLLFNIYAKQDNLINSVEKKLVKRSERDKYTPKTTDLGIESSGVLDIATDSSNTVHIVWSYNRVLHYGQIKNRKVVNKEIIPHSEGFKMNFIRPRLTVRPDNGNVHLTWMNPKPGTWLVHVWKDSEGWHDEDIWKASGKDHISVPFAVEDLTGTVHAIGHIWTDGSNVTKVKYWRGKSGGSYNNGWTLVEGPKKWRDTAMFIDRSGGVHGVYKSGSDPGKYNFCENGGTFIDGKIEDIPIPNGEQCVSFGDLFVTDNGDVHHVFMAYKGENIYYSLRDKTTGRWSTPIMVSEHKVETCEHEEYPNPWPSIAVNPEGVIYMTWADMPCPDTVANRLNLAVMEKGKIDNEILTLDAEFDTDSKPAICGNDNGIYLLYRDWHKKLILYTEAKASFSIENFAADQKVCAKDYENGTATIKVAIGSPEDYTKVTFYIDDKQIGEKTSAPFEYDWNIGEYTTGKHTIKVVGTPKVGDPEQDSITVDIDCPPSISIPDLFDNVTIYETFTVKPEIADDKDNIDRVEFYVDGKLKLTDKESPYEFTWDTTGLSLGNHNFRIVAYDTSGLSDKVTVIVKYWPIFPPSNLTGVKRVNRSIFFVNYFSNLKWEKNPKNDENSSIKISNYKVYLIGEEGVRTLLTTVDANTLEYNHENVEKDTEYTYWVTSVDSDGNESRISEVTVK